MFRGQGEGGKILPPRRLLSESVVALAIYPYPMGHCFWEQHLTPLNWEEYPPLWSYLNPQILNDLKDFE